MGDRSSSFHRGDPARTLLSDIATFATSSDNLSIDQNKPQSHGLVLKKLVNKIFIMTKNVRYLTRLSYKLSGGTDFNCQQWNDDVFNWIFCCGLIWEMLLTLGDRHVRKAKN